MKKSYSILKYVAICLVVLGAGTTFYLLLNPSGDHIIQMPKKPASEPAEHDVVVKPRYAEFEEAHTPWFKSALKGDYLNLIKSLLAQREVWWYIGSVILSFVGCHMLFNLLCMPTWLQKLASKKRGKLANNIVSGLHAAFISFGASCYLAKIIDKDYWHMCLCISMGYFLADSWFTSQDYSGKEVCCMLLHHVTVMLCISTAFVPEQVYETYLSSLSPSTLLAQGLLAEIAMPFIYLCWYLISRQQEKSLLFKMLSFVALCCYAVFRVVNFTHIGYALYQNGKSGLPLALFTPIMLLNYYWFFKLCGKAMKALG